MRRHKYNAKRTPCMSVHLCKNGLPKHPSRIEAAFCDFLYLDRRAEDGEVEDYCYLPAKIDLGSGITWGLDFYVWHRNGVQFYVDVKGRETEGFKIRKRMYEARYREANGAMKPLAIVKGHKTRRGYSWDYEWVPLESAP